MNVFKEITEIYILVPALLGLKGNLEMTLASRLSTQVNPSNNTHEFVLRWLFFRPILEIWIRVLN